MESWQVTAIYLPKPKERRTYNRIGVQVETYVPEAHGKEWCWIVYARDREEAVEIVRRAYCLRGIEEDFSFYAYRVALIG